MADNVWRSDNVCSLTAALQAPYPLHLLLGLLMLCHLLYISEFVVFIYMSLISIKYL